MKFFLVFFVKFKIVLKNREEQEMKLSCLDGVYQGVRNGVNLKILENRNKNFKLVFD